MSAKKQRGKHLYISYRIWSKKATKKEYLLLRGDAPAGVMLFAKPLQRPGAVFRGLLVSSKLAAFCNKEYFAKGDFLFRIIVTSYFDLRKCVYALANKWVRYFQVMIMSVKDAVAARFAALCNQNKIRPNELATRAGVTASTVYSMLDASRRDVSIVTIKKLCDGLDLSLEEFFSGPEFADLEQEIR